MNLSRRILFYLGTEKVLSEIEDKVGQMSEVKSHPLENAGRKSIVKLPS